MVLVPALHPANLIRIGRADTNDLGLARYEQTCLADFAKALRLISQKPEWDERAIWERDSAGRLKNLYPTPDEVIEFCRLARGHLLAVDTETTGESPLDCRMICVGMASANGRVMCVPILNKGGGYYWSQYDAQRVATALRELFAAHDTPKVAHNYVFDSLVLWSHGLPLGGTIECSMQMHHVIDSELPHGLGYCGTRYLDVRYWKDDVKGDEGWLGLENETLRSYNLRDCLVTLRLVPIFARELSNMGLWDLYREEIALAGLMGRATVRGLPIDFVRRDGGTEWDHGDAKKGRAAQWQQVRGLGPILTEKMNGALVTLRALSGDSHFDPLKPVALRNLMFGTLGLPVVKLSKSGLLPSTDKEAMVLLALAADTDVQRAGIKALADFKSAHKAKSTFVDGLPIMGDGRLHVFWKLLTTTGRFASSPNCFDRETEILTPRGWIRGYDLQSDDRVAQWSPDGRIEFVQPTHIFYTTTDSLVHLRRQQHIDLAVTPDHRCLLRHRRTGELRVFRGVDYPQDWQQLQAGLYSGPGIPFSIDEIRLAVAIQADGTTGALKSGRLRVGFSKVRKVERYEALLKRLGAQYKKTEQYNLPDRLYRCWFQTEPCVLSDKIQTLLSREKIFGAWVLQMNREQLDAFVEEVWHWDGCSTRKNHYSSSIKSNTEWVQIALALSGFRTGLREYKSTTGRSNWQTDVTRKDYSLTTNVEKVVVEGRTPVWCVEVPSSYVVVRRNGRIAITGNCQNWSAQIKKIFGWGVTPGGFMPTRRFVGVDLKQAEMRGISYLAPSQRFLEMYEKELDVHTINVAIALTSRPRAGHKDMSAKTEQYLREQIPLLIAGGSYDTTLTEIANDDSWKTTRTLIKKDGFGRNYGADDDTVFRIERSDRDPETNELSFPFLTKSDVEANGIRWRKMNWEIVAWWDKVQKEVKLAGKHVCPVSGRIRWFREGFKRTHILGHPNQTLIASIVNKRMLEIQAIYDRETGGDCLIVQQVHDAINADSHMDYAQRAGQVLQQVFDPPVPLPGFPNAQFPADKPAVGFHLSDV